MQKLREKKPKAQVLKKEGSRFDPLLVASIIIFVTLNQVAMERSVDCDSWQQKVHELIALLWLALGQADHCNQPIDEATYRFFGAQQPLSSTHDDLEKNLSFSIQSQPNSEPLPVREQLNKNSSTPNTMNISFTYSPDSFIMVHSRTLEKLLPHTFHSPLMNTDLMRKAIIDSLPNHRLSAISLYQDPEVKIASKRWALFTYLPSESSPTPKELFVQSIVKAISERLAITITMYSCYNKAFSLHLPVTVGDNEVILFFIDSYLQSNLQAILDTVQSYSRSSPPVEAPFVTIGSIHGRSLRALFLHSSTHADVTLKAALWQSLKALATLTPPQ